MQVGNSLIIHTEFTNRSGNLADPSMVQCWISLPTQEVIELDTSKISTGVYEVEHTITMDGEHWIRVEGTGTITAATEKRLDVATRRVVPDE